MRTMELFSGTASFSHVAMEYGFESMTVDNNPNFNPHIVADLNHYKDYPDILRWLENSDIVWISFPCTTFSMAAGNTHWTRDRQPRTQDAIDGLRLISISKEIAEYCDTHNKIYIIENPRARARWFMPIETRYTVWYCQYGDTRAKPTDIWTNLQSWQPRTCRNNNPYCHHERAPRGSKQGTQGLRQIERGKVPADLIRELLDCCLKELSA